MAEETDPKESSEESTEASPEASGEASSAGGAAESERAEEASAGQEEHLSGDAEASSEQTAEAVADDVAGPEQADSQDAVELDLSQLPDHARSLLRIRVPVMVTLATHRKSIQEITELGQGALVKFEKTYDQPLELSVGGLQIALGSVVKVGDKFGLRIARLIRPHERNAPVDD